MPEILVSMLSARLSPHHVRIGSGSTKSQNSFNANPQQRTWWGGKGRLRTSERGSLALTLYTCHGDRNQVATSATKSE